MTATNGTFTITKKAATVTADAKTKTYGDTDPALTATVEGLVGSDTLNYTLARAEGEDVGEYAITVTLGSNPNYEVTATNGTFTINKKTVTITADAKSKTYGEADPALTATVEGLVGSDTLNYTLARAEGENVGEYAITVTLGENPNYEVTATNGTFTIERPELPTATVTNADPETDLPVYRYDDLSTPIQTVSALDAEYIFTADEPGEATAAYFGTWNADYRVRFSEDIEKDSFGLYGAYSGFGHDYSVAFLFPTDVAKDDNVYLLESAGLSGVTYNDVYQSIEEFICGVFNLSPANNGTTMTVEFVIWQGDNKESAEVITSREYTFGDVATLTCIHVWSDWAVTTEPTCTEAGEETRTCSRCNAQETRPISATGHAWGEVSYVWAEDNSTVTATRTCTHNASHVETETVNTTSEISKPATSATRGETTYTATFTNEAFGTKTKTVDNIPKLPSATATAVEPPKTNVDIYDLGDIGGDPIQTIDQLDTQYRFTANQMETETADYYGSWHADYRVTFNDAFAAESFGLYGAYEGFGNNYDIAFKYPSAVSANDTVYLLEAAGLNGVTCSEVFEIIQVFDCGVFNLSDQNTGKKMTVELVIWQDDDKDSAAVLESVEYTFGKANAIVTAPAVVTGLAYTGSAQALVTAGSTTGGTMQYSLDGTNYSTDIPTATNAGEYTVYYKIVGGQGYNDVPAKTVSVTIAKASASVAAVDNSKTYGEADPALTATVEGMVGSDTLNYTLARESGENAGTYTIIVTLGENPNYEVTATARLIPAHSLPAATAQSRSRRPPAPATR